MTKFVREVESDFLKLVNVPEARKVDFINFAATDFASLKQSLIEYIRAVYPLDFNDFIESDLGIFLVELFAYVGAVLSLKADYLANENFLRTAKNRNNVKKLLELIGVQLKNPISAAGNGIITLGSPLTGSDTEFVIPVANRTLSITSPEDGQPLNFTIYKIEGGKLVDPNATSDLTFDTSESTGLTSSVWENIALIEGALVRETGTFKTTEVIKKVPLTQGPVVERSVRIFIDNDEGESGVYREVPNLFFTSSTDDQVFQVVYGDDLKATVVFGDGIVSKGPAQNSNYIITYRVGGGTRGNIVEDFINVPISVNYEAGTKAGVLENNSPINGGQEAETIENAKKYAPLRFKAQDRLVTLEDYANFANSFTGAIGSTGKATAATRKAFGSANIVDIYLLQKASPVQLQQASIAFKSELLDAMNLKKMLTDEIIIVDGLIRTLDLVVTLNVDKEFQPKQEEIKAKARRKILDFFSPDNFDFGKVLVLGDLARAIFEIDEVRFSTVDNLDTDVFVQFNEIIQLNNLVINLVFV